MAPQCKETTRKKSCRCTSHTRRMGNLAMALMAIALLGVRLDTTCEASVLFDPKNITEYTIRIPALKKPTIFKRFTSSSSRKPSNASAGENGILSTKAGSTSSSNLSPSFGSSLSGPSLSSLLPLSSSVMKLPRGSAVAAPGSFSFPPLPFTAVKGRGPMPVFKYTGPPIWARDAAAFARGQFSTGGPPSFPSILPPPRHGHGHSKRTPHHHTGGKILSSKLPELESQNNMRVVVLRPPYNGLDHGAGDDERSYEESLGHRQFGGGRPRKFIDYHNGNKYKGSSSPNPINDATEIQIINIPPRRGSDRRRFFGSHRHLAGRPTVIRLPPNPMRGFQPSRLPPPMVVNDAPKQFIAEEKPLADGRNTYIISEVDPNQPDMINKLRATFSASHVNNNNNNIFNNQNGDPNDDWNLSLPTTKKSSSSYFHNNMKNFNNLKNPFSIANGAGFNGHSNSIGQSGPNFGSDYGSLLELQSAKQRMHNVNNFHSNSINNNNHNTDSNYNNYKHLGRNNNNHNSNNNNNAYSNTNSNNQNNNNHHSNHNSNSNNNNRFSQQANKHPLVIAVGSAGKDSWEAQKDGVSQWTPGRDQGRRTSMAASHERTNIQVLRTDKESKVVVPPGMIAILVPQNFGVTTATGTVTGSSGNIEFDDDGQPFYESSSTTKKTVVPSPAVLSDISSISDKIEPSKSPGPPYKVDFTQGLPPNAIARPEFFGAQIQNRIGNAGDDADASTSASDEVSIQKTSIPIVLSVSSHKQQLPRKQFEQKRVPLVGDLPRNIELLPPKRINNIRDQIRSSNFDSQPRISTSATLKPTARSQSTSALVTTTPNVHLETATHTQLVHHVQHSGKISRTQRPQLQTRPPLPHTKPPNVLAHHDKKLPTTIARRVSSTTARPFIYSQYQTPPRRTTPSYLSNHRVPTPSPTAYPPPAFDFESAGTYLPRAAALKRAQHGKSHTKIVEPQPATNHYSVPEPTRSSQTFSFHGSVQSARPAIMNPPAKSVNGERRIGRSEQRAVDSPSLTSVQKYIQRQKI